MIQALPEPATVLEERLERGSRILLDMELRGDIGPEYANWLVSWLAWLHQYEALQAA